MQVILLDSSKLGKAGEVVNVKNGYFRNYLDPRKKAVRATKSNIEDFNARRAEIEANSKKLLEQAQEEAKNYENMIIKLARQASEEGRLFGSIRTSDIVDAIYEINNSLKCDRENVILNQSIKDIGEYEITIRLHTDVEAPVKLIISRIE